MHSVLHADTRPWGDFSPAFWKVYRERGVAGLYSGTFPALVRSFPANAALFLGYELTRRGLDGL